MKPSSTDSNSDDSMHSDNLTGAKELQIVSSVFDAIIDQRLKPGTKLSEAALCKAFGVGRMRIRRSLVMLASRDVVEIISNRGAYIASPTKKEAQDVFEARLSMEPSVIKLAILRASSTDISRLKQHLQLEHAAHEIGNRQEAIKLSGQFHIMLAEIADNNVMLRTIKELVARASLIIGLYGSPGVSSCRDEDHNAIMDTFTTGKVEEAAVLMEAHLKRILNNIDLEQTTKSTDDISEIFANN